MYLQTLRRLEYGTLDDWNWFEIYDIKYSASSKTPTKSASIVNYIQNLTTPIRNWGRLQYRILDEWNRFEIYDVSLEIYDVSLEIYDVSFEIYDVSHLFEIYDVSHLVEI